MKKENLIEQLTAAKSLSSTVDIDKVIELINQITLETKIGITQKIADKISEKIERVIDNNSRDLVDLDSAELELDYSNTIRVTDINVHICGIMEHVNAVLDDFIIEEDDDEDSTEEVAN